VRASLEGLACRLSVDQGWPEEELAHLGQVVGLARAIVDRGDWSEALEREWYEYNRSSTG
jgi:GntR family transcriptional regulator of vanillate catabolism